MNKVETGMYRVLILLGGTSTPTASLLWTEVYNCGNREEGSTENAQLSIT